MHRNKRTSLQNGDDQAITKYLHSRSPQGVVYGDKSVAKPIQHKLHHGVHGQAVRVVCAVQIMGKLRTPNKKMPVI